MKKKILLLGVVIALLVCVLVGCSAKTEYKIAKKGYDVIGSVNENGYFVASKDDGLYRVYNMKGKAQFKNGYERLSFFDNDTLLAQNQGDFGPSLIKIDGTVLIEGNADFVIEKITGYASNDIYCDINSMTYTNFVAKNYAYNVRGRNADGHSVTALYKLDGTKVFSYVNARIEAITMSNDTNDDNTYRISNGNSSGFLVSERTFDGLDNVYIYNADYTLIYSKCETTTAEDSIQAIDYDIPYNDIPYVTVAYTKGAIDYIDYIAMNGNSVTIADSDYLATLEYTVSRMDVNSIIAYRSDTEAATQISLFNLKDGTIKTYAANSIANYTESYDFAKISMNNAKYVYIDGQGKELISETDDSIIVSSGIIECVAKKTVYQKLSLAAMFTYETSVSSRDSILSETNADVYSAYIVDGDVRIYKNTTLVKEYKNADGYYYSGTIGNSFIIFKTVTDGTDTVYYDSASNTEKIVSDTSLPVTVSSTDIRYYISNNDKDDFIARDIVFVSGTKTEKIALDAANKVNVSCDLTEDAIVVNDNLSIDTLTFEVEYKKYLEEKDPDAAYSGETYEYTKYYVYAATTIASNGPANDTELFLLYSGYNNVSITSNDNKQFLVSTISSFLYEDYSDVSKCANSSVLYSYEISISKNEADISHSRFVVSMTKVSEAAVSDAILAEGYILVNNATEDGSSYKSSIYNTSFNLLVGAKFYVQDIQDDLVVVKASNDGYCGLIKLTKKGYKVVEDFNKLAIVLTDETYYFLEMKDGIEQYTIKTIEGKKIMNEINAFSKVEPIEGYAEDYTITKEYYVVDQGNGELKLFYVVTNREISFLS